MATSTIFANVVPPHRHEQNPKRIAPEDALQNIHTYLEASKTAAHLHPDATFTEKGPTFSSHATTGGLVLQQLRRVEAGLRGERLGLDTLVLEDFALENGFSGTSADASLPAGDDSQFDQAMEDYTKQRRASTNRYESDQDSSAEQLMRENYQEQLRDQGETDEVGEVGKRSNAVGNVNQAPAVQSTAPKGKKRPREEDKEGDTAGADPALGKDARKKAKKERKKGDKARRESERQMQKDAAEPNEQNHDAANSTNTVSPPPVQTQKENLSPTAKKRTAKKEADLKKVSKSVPVPQDVQVDAGKEGPASPVTQSTAPVEQEQPESLHYQTTTEPPPPQKEETPVEQKARKKAERAARKAQLQSPTANIAPQGNEPKSKVHQNETAPSATVSVDQGEKKGITEAPQPETSPQDALINQAPIDKQESKKERRARRQAEKEAKRKAAETTNNAAPAISVPAPTSSVPAATSPVSPALIPTSSAEVVNSGTTVEDPSKSAIQEIASEPKNRDVESEVAASATPNSKKSKEGRKGRKRLEKEASLKATTETGNAIPHTTSTQTSVPTVPTGASNTYQVNDQTTPVPTPAPPPSSALVAKANDTSTQTPPTSKGAKKESEEERKERRARRKAEKEAKRQFQHASTSSAAQEQTLKSSELPPLSSQTLANGSSPASTAAAAKPIDQPNSKPTPVSHATATTPSASQAQSQPPKEGTRKKESKEERKVRKKAEKEALEQQSQAGASSSATTATPLQQQPNTQLQTQAPAQAQRDEKHGGETKEERDARKKAKKEAKEAKKAAAAAIAASS